MNHSGDAAEQIIRISLEGVDYAIRIVGSPLDLAACKTAITEAMFRGTKRNIESEDDDSKNATTE